MLAQKVRILVVEDDPDMAELICDLLEAEGWEPAHAASAEEAAEVLGRGPVHVVLVDHNLPGTSGRAFAQRLRAGTADLGIIMVTAAGSAAERVLGLETAADDYVVKPFEPIELTARIKALLRRMNPSQRNGEAAERPGGSNRETGRVSSMDGSALILGDWSIDLQNRRAVCRSDPGRTLTAAEFALLEILASTPGAPVSRARILDQLGAETDRHIDRNVDVLVLRLRRKIEPNPDLPRHVLTRRGKGYILQLGAGGPHT